MVLSNIPRGLNRLIGRDADVSALVALLRDSRLVTLTGAGGSGKTRLASEVAAVSANAFPEGIVWIELAPLAEPELLPAHVLDTLGLEHGARPRVAPSHLVLAAVPSSTGQSRWLRAFLECLGVTDAHVFLHAPASILTGDDLDA